MDELEPVVPVETLLEHEGWVRGLARSLVADDSSADDVAQETWLTALREPPRAGGSLRSWLGAVVRSRAIDRSRGERRRERREHAVARRESVGSVADAAAATELHRMLVTAVMALDEPYRASVLLRFFEGLPPREVGARTGVSAEAARTRIKRGVEMLRARLDARHGGDRKRWMALVLPLANGDPGRSARGGTNMGRIGKSAAAAAGLLVLVVAWWALRDDGTPAVAKAPAEPPRTGTTDVAHRTAPRAARPVDDGTAVAAETTPPVPAPPAPDPGARVLLRFVDERGDALPPDVVRRRWGGGIAVPTLALADDRALRGSSGRGWLVQIIGGAGDALRPVPLEQAADGVRVRDRVPRGRWRLVAFPGAAPAAVSRPFTISQDGGELPVDVVLADAPLRLVRTVGDDGAPVAGATLTPRFEFGDDAAFVEGASFTTNAAGECRLPVETGDSRTYQRPPTWWATAPGRAASFQVRATTPDAPDAPIVVKLVRTCEVEGDAFRADGTPAAGCLVAWRKKGFVVEATCDEQGRFRLAGVPVERNKLQFFLLEDAATQRITAGLAKAQPGETVRIRIGAPANDGTGRIVLRVTTGGRPLAGAAVMCGEKESLGRFGATGEDGTVTLGGFSAGAKLSLSVLIGDVRVSDDCKADLRDLAPLAAGEERRVGLDLPGGVLRVHVVTADGAPVAGAAVLAKPAQFEAAPQQGWSIRGGFSAFTGDDGFATLPGLPTGASCTVEVVDGATGDRAKVTAVPGPADQPAEVTVTPAAK